MLPNWLYGKSKSKLQELLGGGGAPSDYNQVKAQVTQNTEDITLLNNAVDAKVGWDDYSKLGAVNLAPNNLATQTIANANCTFTHNDDDSITVNSSGVIKGWSVEVCSMTIKKGTYKLKGTGTDDVKFQIVDNPVTHQLYEAGANDVIMTFATDTAIKLRVTVFNGKSYNNIVIYPMITLASYNGPYVPYAMTNRELTEKLTADGNLGTAVDLSTYAAYSSMYTAPSDGYVHFVSAASGSAARTIYTYGNNTTAATDPHFTHSTSANNKAFEIFIKKGLKVYADGLQSGDAINFYPFS